VIKKCKSSFSFIQIYPDLHEFVLFIFIIINCTYLFQPQHEFTYYGGPPVSLHSHTSHFNNFSLMFNFTAFLNPMEDTDDDISIEIAPTYPIVSPFAPANSSGIFVKDFHVDPGPLAHETFIARRHHAARGDPVPFPLGSQPMAELTPLPCTSSWIPEEDRPHSPPTLFLCDVIFDRDRDYIVGHCDPPPSHGPIQATLSALPNFRTIWMLLNVIGLNLDHPDVLSSGFVSGREVQEHSLFQSIASYSVARTFTSRLEVDLFLGVAAFSVQVEVSNFHWITVAPLFICRIIQDWASSHNTSAAIIRSHPNLDSAFADISSSLDSQGRLAFLSPLRFSQNLSHLQPAKLTNGSYQYPDLPRDLPSHSSQGCFRPTSMIVLNFPYRESQESDWRGFTVLSTEWGNSPVRVDRCVGFSDMVTVVSRTHGNALVLPFLEGPSALHCPLTFSLVQWLPFFCWPVPSQDGGEIAQTISASFHPLTTVNRFSSQVSQDGEGSV